MATIDERVVAMSFENSRFEANVAATMASLTKLDGAIAQIGKVNGLASIESSANKVTLTGPMTALDKLKQKLGMTNAGSTFTDIEKASDKVALTEPMSALDKLKQKLGFTTAGTTFTDMEKAADRVTFSGLSSAIDGISTRFSTMKTAAAVALGNIYTQVLNVAGQVAKSFTIDPLKAGFKDYETQINAVQTILANTGLKGKAGLDQVTASLKDLQNYANLTVYNFADMAKNIGTFTAAGVDLKTSTESIKGIANLAALSGSSAEQASGAMYQLSQAIAAGKVGLQDWNSVVTAGIGGSVFQKALVNAAIAMGTLKESSVKLVGPMKTLTVNGENFRQSISAGKKGDSWLTSGVLTTALKNFTGDMSEAQLKAEGFNDAQIKVIQTQAKTAVNAATQVKTFSQLTSALKEEVGTAYGNIFQTLFGNIDQATVLFSGLHNFIEAALTNPLKNLEKVLQDWAALGGRTQLLAGLKSAFQDLKAVVEPIKQAFRDIFPPETAQTLLTLTTNFRTLMDHLRASPQTMANIRKTFDGFFAVLHIGWTIIKDVIGVLGQLLGASKGAAGGFLGFTATVGEFLKHLDDTIKKEGLIKGLFGGLVQALQHPLDLIKKIGEAIKNLFTGGASEGASKFSGALGTVHDALKPLDTVLDNVSKAWKRFLDIVDEVKTKLDPVFGDLAHVVSNFITKIATLIKNGDYSQIFSAINTVLLGGIFLAIKKALGGGVSIDFGGGVLKNISKTFEALTGNLEAMQKNVQAHTLLTIAAAIGILAAAVFALSLINSKKLQESMTAVAVGMGELVGAMYILNKGVGGAAFARLPFIAASMIGLSAAMILLAGAMKIFATMSWDQIAKGLVGVGGGLAAINLAIRGMSGPQLVITAAALIPLALGLNVLALAMKIFATMSWEQIAKGLVGVAGSLLAIGLSLRAMPPSLPLTALGLIGVATGLVILSGAIFSFGHMSLDTIAKGILATAGSLVVIAGAMQLFPPGPALILQAAALILVATGLTSLGVALRIMGSMRIDTMIQGLIGMGGALAILAVGLEAMSGTLPGSLGLLAAAAAFAILGPAIAFIGHLQIGTILKGILGMGLALATLAIAGAIAAVPLAALGVGLLAVGAGIAAIGGGVYLIAKGLSLLSDTSTKAIASLVAAVTAFIAVIPSMTMSFLKGLVSILQSVVALAPQIVAGLVKIAGDLLTGVAQLAPQIATAIGVLVTQLIAVLDQNVGPIVAAGYRLLLNLLKGLANNIGPVTAQVVNVISNFLNALANNAPRLVAGGANVISNFLKGIAGKLPNILATGGSIVVALITGIASNLVRIVGAAGNLISRFIGALAAQIPKLINSGTSIIVNFLNGIANAIPRVINAGVNLVVKLVNGISSAGVRLANAGFNAIINFLNGIANAIRTHNAALWNAGWNVANALIDGMINGLTNLAGHLVQKAEQIALSLPSKFLKVLGISSPSKVMEDIGKNVMLGLAQGIDNSFNNVDSSMTDAANGIVSSAKTAFGQIPDALSSIIDVQPTITPVLDLSGVKKDASALADLMPGPVITAATSTRQASVISDQQAALVAAATGQPAAQTFNFEQNNYSPDPLSNIEIYRQTNNQLSRLKSLVGVG